MGGPVAGRARAVHIDGGRGGAALTTLEVTADGQLTLEEKLVRHLGVAPGQRVAVRVLPGGRIEMRAATPGGTIESFIGVLAGKSKARLGIDEMNVGDFFGSGARLGLVGAGVAQCRVELRPHQGHRTAIAFAHLALKDIEPRPVRHQRRSPRPGTSRLEVVGSGSGSATWVMRMPVLAKRNQNGRFRLSDKGLEPFLAISPVRRRRAG